MFSRRAPLIASCLLLLATGCFEIKEVVKFNKDGSGTFTLMVGIQEQFRALVAMSRKMKQQKAREQAEAAKKARENEKDSSAVRDEDSELADLERELEETDREEKQPQVNDFDASKAKIEKLPGITNVRSVRDEENFRFGMHFDFASVEALNRALHQLQKNPGAEQPKYFAFSAGSFERLARVGFKDSLQESMSKSKPGGAGSDFNPAALGIKFMYITEYTFPGEIRKVSNPRAQVLPDKHTVRMEHSMFDPDQRETNVGNQIQFKRWYHTCLPFL